MGVVPEEANVVFAGDFNSGRQESVWKLLHRWGPLTPACLPNPHVPRGLWVLKS